MIILSEIPVASSKSIRFGAYSHCSDTEGGWFFLMNMNVLFKTHVINLWWPRNKSNSKLI